VKLVITVTDDTPSANDQDSQLMTGAVAGGSASPGADGTAQAFDGGAMPEALRAMAQEVDAGRMPGPGPR
jgi:hypothetical protein